MPDVLFFLLLGHVFGDYALQTDDMAQQKGTSLRVLSLHVSIYTLVIGLFWWLGKRLNGDLLFPGISVIPILSALYVQHWLQDHLKCRFSRGRKQFLFMDQALHLSVLYLIRILF